MWDHSCMLSHRKLIRQSDCIQCEAGFTPPQSKDKNALSQQQSSKQACLPRSIATGYDFEVQLTIMLTSVLPFSPDLVDRVAEYCEKHSFANGLDTLALPESLDKHWEWTVRSWLDAEMMSSKLQGQWMIWMGQWIAPKRGKKFLEAPISPIIGGWYIKTLIVLELGTFTGFSALAWYEGTRETKAEIITLDIRGEVLNFARKLFRDLKVNDRIQVMEGPASSS